jgi:hypothetical protein
MYTKLWPENLKLRDHVEEKNIKMNLREGCDYVGWTESNEHGNELSDHIKGGNFLEELDER